MSDPSTTSGEEHAVLEAEAPQNGATHVDASAPEHVTETQVVGEGDTGGTTEEAPTVDIDLEAATAVESAPEGTQKKAFKTVKERAAEARAKKGQAPVKGKRGAGKAAGKSVAAKGPGRAPKDPNKKTKAQESAEARRAANAAAKAARDAEKAAKKAEREAKRTPVILSEMGPEVVAAFQRDITDEDFKSLRRPKASREDIAAGYAMALRSMSQAGKKNKMPKIQASAAAS